MFKFKRFGIAVGLLFAAGVALSGVSYADSVALGLDPDAYAFESGALCSMGEPTDLLVKDGVKIFKPNGKVLDAAGTRSRLDSWIHKNGEDSQVRLFFSLGFDEKGSKESSLFSKIGDKVAVRVVNSNGDVIDKGEVDLFISKKYGKVLVYEKWFQNEQKIVDAIGPDGLKGLRIEIFGGENLDEPVMSVKLNDLEYLKSGNGEGASNSDDAVVSTGCFRELKSDGVHSFPRPTEMRRRFWKNNLKFYDPDGRALKADATKSELAVSFYDDSLSSTFLLAFDDGSVFDKIGDKVAVKIFGPFKYNGEDVTVIGEEVKVKKDVDGQRYITFDRFSKMLPGVVKALLKEFLSREGWRLEICGGENLDELITYAELDDLREHPIDFSDDSGAVAVPVARSERESSGEPTDELVKDGVKIFKPNGEVLDAAETQSRLDSWIEKDGEDSQVRLFFSLGFDKEGSKESSLFSKIGDKVAVRVVNSNGDVIDEGEVDLSISKKYGKVLVYEKWFQNEQRIVDAIGPDGLKGLRIEIFGGENLDEPVMSVKLNDLEYSKSGSSVKKSLKKGKSSNKNRRKKQAVR